MTVNQREAAAHHEAGHAVITLIVGADLKRVTILARRRRIHGNVMQTRGYTEFSLPFDMSESDSRMKNAVITLAGPLAQERYLGRRPVGIDSISCEEHYVLGLAAEARGRGNGCLDWFGDRLDEARRLVAKHWPLIQVVAKALLDRGSLAGSEVEELACAAGLRAPQPFEIVRRELERRWREIHARTG